MIPGNPSRRLAVLLAATFALTISSFLGSRVVTEYQLRGTRQAALQITHTLPDLEWLTKTRTEISRTEGVVRAFVEADGEPANVEELRHELQDARKRRRQSWAVYVSAPVIVGERELIDRAESDMAAMDVAVEQAIESTIREEPTAVSHEKEARAVAAIDRADDAVQAATELNRVTAMAAADSITVQRAAARTWGVALDGLSVLLATASVVLLIRVLRRYWSAVGDRMAELERFAGRVAHDIRSPLATVGFALDVAKRHPGMEARTVSSLDRGTRTLQRIGQLLDGLLVFAVAGKPPKDVRGANVREVLDGLLEDLRPDAEEKGIAVDYESPDPALLAACNPGVLSSMTTNLVGNAIKYMGDAPTKELKVRARLVGRAIRVEIADTGPGVPPDVRDKLFDPYVRGADSKVPGLGLGLATVRRLAEAHGGSVGVRPNVSAGSVFWFELPRWEKPERTAATEAAPSLHGFRARIARVAKKIGAAYGGH